MPQDPKARLKVLRVLLVGAKSAVEQGMALAKQESTLPLIEAVVQAVELAATDPTVRDDIAAKFTRVSFVPCAPEVGFPLPIPRGTRCMSMKNSLSHVYERKIATCD